MLPGMPLVHVNSAFEKLTGLSSEECIGRNCRFLQGAKTEAESVLRIAEAVRRHVPCDVPITNYRKDGSTFTNLLSLRMILDVNSPHPRVVFCTLHKQQARRRNPQAPVAPTPPSTPPDQLPHEPPQ